MVRLQTKLCGCAARYCSQPLIIYSTNALDHLLQLSLSNTILTVCHKEDRDTANECPVMDHHVWYSNGYQSNRKLAGTRCLIRKWKNRAKWLIRKSGRVCWKMARNSKPYSSFPLTRLVFSSDRIPRFPVSNF